MRKIFSLLMILVLILSGCGKKEESTTENGESDTEEPAQSISLIVNVPGDSESQLYSCFSTFKSEVESATDNLVTVELRTGKDAVKSGKEMSSVQKGDIDIAIVNRNELVELNPFMKMFDSWFLFLDYEHYRIAIEDKVGEIMFKEIETNSGLKVLESLYEDSKVFMIRGYEGFKTTEDFANIDMGVKSSEVSVAEAKALGANAVVIVPSKTYKYLAEKMINGYEVYLDEIRENKYYEITDTIIDSNHVFDFNLIIMNPEKWNSLSVEQKDAVNTAIDHLVSSYDAYMINERKEQISFYASIGMAIDTLEQDQFFYTFQELYRGNVEYTNAWNTEYYERILRLGINLMNEREAAKDLVISGQ